MMKILGTLATSIGLATVISFAAASAADRNGEIKLVTTLDEPRGYCVDMSGSKQTAQDSAVAVSARSSSVETPKP